MTVRSAIWTSVAFAALVVAACKTNQTAAPSSAGEVSAGTPAGTSGSGTS